jgi:hypothetical protein
MMEQLAERRMQREEDAAGAIEAESDEDSEEEGDGSDRDDEGDDDVVSEDDDDDEDEEDGEEEVLIPSFLLPLFTHLIILFLSRRCPRSKRWRKANECFPSLLHACSNNVYCKPTERKLLRNASYSSSANLTTKTR